MLPYGFCPRMFVNENMTRVSQPISRFPMGRKGAMKTDHLHSLPLRKRARLDYLTEEQKLMRRKILNREAAQKARDRKRDIMDSMEYSLSCLRLENDYLKSSNRALKAKFLEQESKFLALQEKLKEILSHIEKLSGHRIESQESAELLPQQKGVALWFLVLLLLWRFMKTESVSVVRKNQFKSVSLRSLMAILSKYRPRMRMKIRLRQFQNASVT